jgi:hypothetical protein
MGPNGFEPSTSSLSGTRSNQLSYEPEPPGRLPFGSGTEDCKGIWRRVNLAKTTIYPRIG